MLMCLTLSASVVSCGGDDDEPSAVAGQLSITNKSSDTLSDFVVHFTNDKNEIITREEKGTLKTNETIKVDIPIGATYYYMSTVAGRYRYFSPDYQTSVKKQVITDQTLGNWKTN